MSEDRKRRIDSLVSEYVSLAAKIDAFEDEYGQLTPDDVEECDTGFERADYWAVDSLSALICDATDDQEVPERSPVTLPLPFNEAPIQESPGAMATISNEGYYGGISRSSLAYVQMQASTASAPTLRDVQQIMLNQRAIWPVGWSMVTAVDPAAGSITLSSNPPAFSGVFVGTDSPKEPAKCECGAEKVGVKAYAPGHSSWCDVSKKEGA